MKTLSLEERLFLAQYADFVLKNGKMDKNVRKRISRLKDKLQENTAGASFSTKEKRLMLDMCDGGARLGKLRLQKVESMKWYKKLAQYSLYKKTLKSLKRIIANHENIIVKLNEATKEHSGSNPRAKKG